MLNAEQRREILAVALLAVALFVLLSLVPVTVFGPRGEAWFPEGNMMGIVGGTLHGIVTAFLGGTAFALPPLIGLGGLYVGGWLQPARALKAGVLGIGLLVLVPPTVWIMTGAPLASGWLGRTLGDPLVSWLGWLGAVLLCVVALVALSVGTLGWNPLRSVGRGVVAGGGAAGRAARTLAVKGFELAEEARAAGVEDATRPDARLGVPPVPGLEPEWLMAAEDDEEALPWDDTPDGEEEEAEEEVEEEPVRVGSRRGGKSRGAGGATAPRGDEGHAEEEEDEDELPDPNADSGAGVEVPPVDLLSPPERIDRATMERGLDELGQILVDKLRTFNVESELGGRTTGPVVTQFEVIPAPGVKVNRIANLDADLALAMKAQTIRIVAPIPGKGAVGVEIPNPDKEVVNLREILETPAFKQAKGDLPLALGKDLSGRPYVTPLEKMPHLLIAGATGSGKSVCINTIVTSLVYRHTPETLRLLMIDPKMVELSVYSRLPHLRHNVVTDPRDAAGVLKWAVIEMERRYALLKANHVRSIAEFNRKVRDGALLKRSEPKGPEGDEDRWIYQEGLMPYIVVVVDELADLMMTVQSEIEKPLTQLAQKARAIGIHLIVATQRPSVNVITGLIKANFPTRIAFRVASKTDSRTILDQNGADALLGNGDMLFLPPGRSDPVRIQGAFLPTEDTERLMGWYVELLERHGPKGQPDEPIPETDILDELRSQEMEDAAVQAEEISGDWDELFRAAAEVCIQNGNGSTSLLQRRLSIGYGRAARIVDQLHDAGVLGPSDGAKGREVLISMDELDGICGSGPLS
jgi:S-DNA-T family DNA segregation ATPase FtsK/SpoIIIE